MLSGGCIHIILRSSHFVPIPTCLSLCLHTRTPHLQSPSHFPSRVMTSQQRPFTTASESIYILISGHFFLHKLDGQVHHSKLCPLRWFSLTTVIQGQAEWGCNATINHFHFAPIYQAVLSLNKAQTFSSSFSWSMVSQVWAEIGVRGNHDEWYGSLGYLFMHLLVPSGLLHAWFQVYRFIFYKTTADPDQLGNPRGPNWWWIIQVASSFRASWSRVPSLSGLSTLGAVFQKMRDSCYRYHDLAPKPQGSDLWFFPIGVCLTLHLFPPLTSGMP